MSFLKKLLPFLYKDKAQPTQPAQASAAQPKPKAPAPKPQNGPASRPAQPQSSPRPDQQRENRPERQERQPRPDRENRDNREDREEREEREPGPIVGYAIVARCKSHKGLRKGSRVYVRQIMDDDRLRVRGTSVAGKKITISVHRHALMDYEAEGVPEHLARHYSPDSIFQEEHEANIKAEALGKR